MGTSLRDVDPVFAEIAKSLLGGEVDVRPLWDIAKLGPDPSEVHVDDAGAPSAKKKKGLGAGLLLGTAAEGTATAQATREAFPRVGQAAARAAQPVTNVLKPILSGIPKLSAGGASKAHFALQAANFGVGLTAAHELLKKPKPPKGASSIPLAKGLKMPKGWRTPRGAALRVTPKLHPIDTASARAQTEQRARMIATGKRGTTSTYGRVLKREPVSLVPVGEVDQLQLLWSGEIAKFDTDKRQVFGWCSLSEVDGQPVVDLQGDYVPIEEVEKSAYRYVLESRKGGDMHKRVTKGLTTNWDEPVHTADLVESFVVTPEKLEKMGLPGDSLPLGWWVGFKVNDDQQWNLVKSGERAGFSIHGTGQRRPYEQVAKAHQHRNRANAKGSHVNPVISNPRPTEEGRRPSTRGLIRGSSGDFGHGRDECKTCGLQVGQKADGTLRNHRVGSGRQSWPCPGGGSLGRAARALHKRAISKALEDDGWNRKPSHSQRLARAKTEAWTGTAMHASTVYNHATDSSVFRPAMHEGRAVFVRQEPNREVAQHAGQQLRRSTELAHRYGQVARARSSKTLRPVPTTRQVRRAVVAATRVRKGEDIDKAYVPKKTREQATGRLRNAASPPPVQLTPVRSSAIRAAGYQKPTRRLAVEMNSRPGQPYQYRVKPKQAQQFLGADSLGRAYSQQIRGKAKRATGYTLGDRARLLLTPVNGTN